MSQVERGFRRRDKVFPTCHIPPSTFQLKGSPMEKAPEKLDEQILAFDEASLSSLREKYRLKIDNFDGTQDWKKTVGIS